MKRLRKCVLGLLLTLVLATGTFVESALASGFTTDGTSSVPVSVSITGSYTLTLPAALSASSLVVGDSNRYRTTQYGYLYFDFPITVTMDNYTNRVLQTDIKGTTITGENSGKVYCLNMPLGQTFIYNEDTLYYTLPLSLRDNLENYTNTPEGRKAFMIDTISEAVGSISFIDHKTEFADDAEITNSSFDGQTNIIKYITITDPDTGDEYDTVISVAGLFTDETDTCTSHVMIGVFDPAVTNEDEDNEGTYKMEKVKNLLSDSYSGTLTVSWNSTMIDNRLLGE